MHKLLLGKSKVCQVLPASAPLYVLHFSEHCKEQRSTTRMEKFGEYAIWN